MTDNFACHMFFHYAIFHIPSKKHLFSPHLETGQDTGPVGIQRLQGKWCGTASQPGDSYSCSSASPGWGAPSWKAATLLSGSSSNCAEQPRRRKTEPSVKCCGWVLNEQPALPVNHMCEPILHLLAITLDAQKKIPWNWETACSAHRNTHCCSKLPIPGQKFTMRWLLSTAWSMSFWSTTSFRKYIPLVF